MRPIKCAVLLCLLMLTPGGVSVAQDYDDKVLFFEHWRHYDSQGIACEFCHKTLSGGQFSLPGHQVCEVCHKPGETSDYEETAKPTCFKCHPKDNSRAVTRLSLMSRDKRYFFHSEKLGNICDVCHGKMVEDEIPLGVVISSKKERIRMRQKAHYFYGSNSCHKCHKNMEATDIPENHTTNWDVEHAKVAPKFNCRICHTKSFCQDCHETIY